MRHNISSGVRKKFFWEFIIKVECTSAVIFLWDMIKKKNQKRLNYRIEEWHTSTPYDIFRNKSTYPTVCLLLDMWNRTNQCITVWSEWIFDSNFEFAFPLTQYCLNCICRGNYTDVVRFVGVLYAIISVPPVVFQRRLNMKQELLVIIIIVIITIYIVVIFICHIFIMINILSCFNFIQYYLMIVFR